MEPSLATSLDLPWDTSGVDDVTPTEREALWRAGQLFWLLHGDQALAYFDYRKWEETAHQDPKGGYRVLWVFDCGRRWGKDWLCLLIKLEDCIRRPGATHIYATAFAKDINEIVIPLMRELLRTCPEDLAPSYRTTRMGESRGFYFPNGSVLKLVGIDKNPDGLRGRGLDGVVVTEAGYVKKLEESVVSVVYPQLQGRPWARIILQSTAPTTPNHPYDRVFLKDAKRRGAWCSRTIEDNPMLTVEEREHFIEAAGGRDHPRCRREYFGERVQNPSDALVPEFNVKLHVRPTHSIEWADTYVAADPGIRDLCGIVWAYWDAARAKLVVQRAWAERNAGTAHVAQVWTDTERDLWGPRPDNLAGCRWWDGTSIRTAPYARVSDTDLRLLTDLQVDHGLNVMPADKTDSKEASLYTLRDWFYNDRIEIDPVGASLLIEHLTEGRWNPHRTDYLRSAEYGHFDLIDALRYLVRHVDRERNPKPPDHVLNPGLQRAIAAPVVTSRTAAAMNATFARPNRWKR